MKNKLAVGLSVAVVAFAVGIFLKKTKKILQVKQDAKKIKKPSRHLTNVFHHAKNRANAYKANHIVM